MLAIQLAISWLANTCFHLCSRQACFHQQSWRNCSMQRTMSFVDRCRLRGIKPSAFWLSMVEPSPCQNWGSYPSTSAKPYSFCNLGQVRFGSAVDKMLPPKSKIQKRVRPRWHFNCLGRSIRRFCISIVDQVHSWILATWILQDIRRGSGNEGGGPWFLEWPIVWECDAVQFSCGIHALGK